jgi:hypothetical protein
MFSCNRLCVAPAFPHTVSRPQMLPGAREETEARLAAVDAELLHLEAVHQKAELQSERITSLIMTGGAVVLFTQLVAFIYLTW